MAIQGRTNTGVLGPKVCFQGKFLRFYKKRGIKVRVGGLHGWGFCIVSGISHPGQAMVDHYLRTGSVKFLEGRHHLNGQFGSHCEMIAPA